MSKEDFLRELEHIAESGSNEIRLGELFRRVASQAVEDYKEKLKAETLAIQQSVSRAKMEVGAGTPESFALSGQMIAYNGILKLIDSIK